MSDDQGKRYQLDYHHTQTYAEMVEDCDGDWVKYNDYKAASDRIEELELAVRYEADLAQQAEARIEELEAKLAIALCAGMEKAAVICESKFQSRNTVYEKSRRDAALEIRATIAELKGEQDDNR